jgi:phage FluMu gp28-like protein
VTVEDSRRVSAEFLAEEKAAMPESWFRQEYYCEFRDAIDAVFTHEVIQAAASSEVPALFGPDSPFSLIGRMGR